MAKSNKIREIEQSYSKLPPQAVDLEEAVLGAIMNEKDAIIQIADILHPDMFYKEAHVRVCGAIMDLFREMKPIDMLTVTAKLRSTGELEQCGGPAFIMELTSKVNSGAHIEYHARIISEAYIKREIIKACQKAMNKAYEDTTDAFQLMDEIETDIFLLAQNQMKRNYVTVGKGISKALTEMDDKKNVGDSMAGVPTGLSAMDKLTGGFQRGELSVLAARPGQGKTALIVTSLRNAAVDFDKPVALFSLEMSTNQIINRMLSAEAEIDGEKIKRGSLNTAEWEKLHKRIARLMVSKIFIDDTPSLSLMELRAKARRLKAEHDIQMIVIDYLQLMTNLINGKANGVREQEIAQISRGLKSLAKELDIPIVALSQLSRAVESRGGEKRPQLSDLRESGAIEQDADVVIFLYRPEYYGVTADADGNSLFGVAEVIVAKNRSGSLDTVKLKFTGRYTKFENPDSSLNPEISFEQPVSLDVPVIKFDPGKQSAIFDYTPLTEEDESPF